MGLLGQGPAGQSARSTGAAWLCAAPPGGAFPTPLKLGWGRGRGRVQPSDSLRKQQKLSPVQGVVPEEPTARWTEESFIQSSLEWAEEEAHRQAIDLQVQGEKSVEMKVYTACDRYYFVSSKVHRRFLCSLDVAIKIPLQSQSVFHNPTKSGQRELMAERKI